MSEKTTKVRTTQSIVNPSYDPRRGGDAVFAPGSEVSVPDSLAQAWITSGQAESLKVKEAQTEEAEAEKPKKRRGEK